MSVKLFAVLACAAVVASCAGHTTNTANTGAFATRERDVITRAELLDPALSTMNVIEVVRRLRPHFLSDRGVSSRNDPDAGRVHASIDNSTVIDLNELRNMLASHVIEIRFLNAGAAMQKFGGAAREGPVIVVKTM